MRLQVEGLRDENERLAALRDEAVETREAAIQMREAIEMSLDSPPPAPADASELPAAAQRSSQQPEARAPRERLKGSLEEGQWQVARQEGGHPVYKRWVVMVGERETREQTFAHAATPSCSRSLLNSISDLRAMDADVMMVVPAAQAGQPASVRGRAASRRGVRGHRSSGGAVRRALALTA